MEDTQKMVDVRGIEPRCPALSTNSNYMFSHFKLQSNIKSGQKY